VASVQGEIEHRYYCVCHWLNFVVA